MHRRQLPIHLGQTDWPGYYGTDHLWRANILDYWLIRGHDRDLFWHLVGALAGYYGGVLDSVLMRVTEAMLNIPEIFLLIVMAKFLLRQDSGSGNHGPDVQRQCSCIVVIIGATAWMYLARIVQG